MSSVEDSNIEAKLEKLKALEDAVVNEWEGYESALRTYRYMGCVHDEVTNILSDIHKSIEAHIKWAIVGSSSDQGFYYLDERFDEDVSSRLYELLDRHEALRNEYRIK